MPSSEDEETPTEDYVRNSTDEQLREIIRQQPPFPATRHMWNRHLAIEELKRRHPDEAHIYGEAILPGDDAVEKYLAEFGSMHIGTGAARHAFAAGWDARRRYDEEPTPVNYTEEDLLELIERHDEHEAFYRQKLEELYAEQDKEAICEECGELHYPHESCEDVRRALSGADS